MEDDQQFCLRWNNHQSTLVAVFDTLLENGTLVDCTLAAEGKYLNAHKVVLSACSPYFESLLSQNYDKHPIFILKDVKFQELKAMMDYMYRGEVNISQDQLGALLKAAESLQIKGLSDNKKEGEARKQPLAPAKSPPPATTLPRVQGLTIEQRRANRNVDDSREGSQSPGPRKRKRMRRRSTDDLDNHHDASNSSESHHSNPTPIQNIPIALPPASSSKLAAADVPEPVETKSEILTRHKIPVANESELPQVPIIKEKIETHSELMLEPKAEYVEEMNEESIEDLTLDDDDDISNLEMSNDGAGPSHGNAGEGSSQGFAGWHMGNQNQDEVFLAAQEAVGAHRDSQVKFRAEQKLTGICQALKRIEVVLAEVIAKLEGIENSIITGCGELIQNRIMTDQATKIFPLDSIEDVLEFEEHLKNETYQRKIVAHLKRITGAAQPWKSAAYKLSSTLFTKKLLTMFSWTGVSRSNTSKEAFNKLVHILEVFFEVIFFADNTFCHYQKEEFFKDCILKHSRSRLNPKKRILKAKTDNPGESIGSDYGSNKDDNRVDDNAGNDNYFIKLEDISASDADVNE